MRRSKKTKKQNPISDEMEARINGASTSELEAIMAEAGHRYETAKEHLDTDPDICAATAKVVNGPLFPKGAE